MMQLYDHTTFKTSQLITRSYSTSFSLATSWFDKNTRDAIYSIYGFVRFADEIVDTFHGFDKEYLLAKFEADYYDAIKQGISLNPILHSFQKTVKKYNIPDEHIQSFLTSMKHDLEKKDYENKSEIDNYIYGSADVVGLMCLKVFCNGNDALYKELEFPAMKLGSAFQKVNFLRDLKNDIENLDRRYFPQIDENTFNNDNKIALINDIEKDFEIAYSGIKRLPGRSKLSVLIAYYYYKNLLRKIKNTQANEILESRIHISNTRKIALLIGSILIYKLRLV
jgi:phytoene synthase